jgi:hypothetical protein
MSFFDEKDDNKKEPIFKISGMVENIDIEEDTPKKRGGPQPMGRAGGGPEEMVDQICQMFGVTPEDLEKTMAKFEDLLERGSDPDFLEELGDHMVIKNDGAHQKHFALDNIGLQMVLDKFLGGDHTPPKLSNIFPNKGGMKKEKDISEFFTELMGMDKEEASELIEQIIDIVTKGASDEDVEKLIGITSSKNKNEEDFDLEEIITSYDFDIIADDESFGAVKYVKSDNLYEDFKDIYGESPYSMPTFVATKGYNLIPAFMSIDTLEYVGNNEKYILFMAHSNSPDVEDFVTAVIKTDDGSFDFIVPEFGNSYNIETGEAINKVIDTHMYHEKEDKNGTISLELKHPIDPERIKGGLDLVLYEYKEPILSVKDFGEVFSSPTPCVFNSAYIRVGRIKANKTKEVEMFRSHCDLDDSKEFFDFYVKLSDELPPRTLDAIQKYFEHIDFNNNPKVQCAELKAKNYESVYIDLDLGNLESFARMWL